MSPPLATLPYFAGFSRIGSKGSCGEFAFGPDPGLLLILLKAPRRYAPEHFAFLTQVAADANGGVSTGFNWERGWEHG